MTTVTFIGDYFTLTTAVIAPQEYDRDTVIEEAADLLLGFYGWDVSSVATDVQVEI